MRSTTVHEDRWFRPVWLGLLTVASAGLTTVFTCITPFAAFAVVAALSLSRGTAVSLTLVLWLANQAVGYGVLAYPWNARSFAWGLAIGGAAVIGTLAAHWAAGRVRSYGSPVREAVRALAAFVAAFALYQLALYAVAVSALGGTGAFVPGIVGQVLLVNAVTLVGLYGLDHLVAAAVGFVNRRRRAEGLPARFA